MFNKHLYDVKLDPFYKREIEEMMTCKNLGLTRTEYRGPKDYTAIQQSKLKLLSSVLYEIEEEKAKEQERKANFAAARAKRSGGRY